MANDANVRVMVSAITEAAESALEDVGDEMVGLTDDSAVAQSGLDQVESELGSSATRAAILSGALDELSNEMLNSAAASSLLGGRVESTSDEMRQGAVSAGILSSAYSRLTVSAGGLSVSLGVLSSVMSGALLSSALTLSTTLAPLAAVMATLAGAALSLAGAFGLVVGAGVITHMEELRNAFASARKEIVELLQPLGEVFGPLLVDAVKSLPELVSGILSAIGPVQVFADTLREFGGIAMSVIPGIVGAMFDFARVALPAVKDLIDYLRGNAAAGMSRMTDATRRLTPELMGLLDGLLDLLPSILEFGTAVADLVIPTLTNLAGVINGVLEYVNGLSSDLRDLAIAGAITAPAILSVAAAVGSLAGPLGIAAAAVASFMAAFRSNFMGLRDLTERALGPVVSRVEDVAGRLGTAFADLNLGDQIQSSLSELAGSSEVQALRTELVKLGDIISVHISQTLSDLMPILKEFVGTYAANGDKFIQFGRMAVRGTTAAVRALQVLAEAASYVIQTFLIPLLDRLVSVWSEHFGKILGEYVETINALVSYARPMLQTLSDLWDSHGSTILDTVKFVFDGLLGITATALDAYFAVYMAVLNLIQGEWGAAWGNIRTFAVEALRGVGDFLRTWGITRIVGRAVSGVQRWFRNLQRSAGNTVSGIQQSFQDAVTFFTKKLPRQIKKGMLLAGAALLTVMFGVDRAKAIIYGLSEAWEGVQKTFNAVASRISGIVDGLKATISSAISDITTLFTETIPAKFQQGVSAITQALAPLTSWFTDKLLPAAILGLAKLIGTVQSIASRIRNVFATLWNGLVDMLVGAINSMIDIIVQGINSWLSKIDDVSNTVEKVTGQSLPDIQTISGTEVSANQFRAQTGTVSQRQASQRAAQEIAVTLGFDVTGEGPLAEFVDQRAEAKYQSNSRGNSRRSHRQNPNQV